MRLADGCTRSVSPSLQALPPRQHQQQPACLPAGECSFRVTPSHVSSCAVLCCVRCHAVMRYAGILNGGILSTLLDCHGNWTAAISLMDRSCLPKPPLTLTASMLVRLLLCWCWWWSDRGKGCGGRDKHTYKHKCTHPTRSVQLCALYAATAIVSSSWQQGLCFVWRRVTPTYTNPQP